MNYPQHDEKYFSFLNLPTLMNVAIVSQHINPWPADFQNLIPAN